LVVVVVVAAVVVVVTSLQGLLAAGFSDSHVQHC
jgi:hypothetical protein